MRTFIIISPFIYMITESKRIQWAEYVACKRQLTNTHISVRNEHFRDLGINGRIP
jgi:hypothetical protein